MSRQAAPPPLQPSALPWSSLQRLAFLVAILTLLAGLACTGMQRSGARQSYIYEQVREYVYETPIDAVWPQARAILFEQGYQVRDSGGGMTVETEWRVLSDGSRRRYLVTGFPRGNGCAIHFTSDTENTQGRADTGRDLGMEWGLIRRVEPQRATRIEAEANAYAYQLHPDT